ncbi:hypothetical protein SCUCBS95973_006413 [Sporothrix curviconia]|uniref:Xylanolytic transcriptional activator regulatory domain-containing protein n=1 Tax=Sporothrix curviconia TaxID=1260050 RepID=A0ABP0C585_9PEZI
MALQNAAAGNSPNQFLLVTDMEASARKRQRVRVSRACGRCKHRSREPARADIRAQTRLARSARRAQPDAGSPLSTHSTLSASEPLPVTPSHNNGSHSQPTATVPAIIDETRPEDAAAQLREPVSRGSPDDPTTDMQGHYVGPASGLLFLLRIQKRLLASDPASPSSTTFTFGDAPLPQYDPVPSVMLSAEAASTLVARFFDYTMPVDRFFHRPTIEAWLHEFLRTMGDTDEARDRRAVLWMIFAMAQEHMEQSSPDDKRYVRPSKPARGYQLSKTYGTVTLARFQAQLCQCYWLLGRSRINHCWELFGSTARLALALGLHRRRFGRHTGHETTALHLECSRKTFWSAYYLDTYLTKTFGRPPIFHNDDINQEMPMGADDGELQASLYGAAMPAAMAQIMPQADDSCSVALAPVAFYKLARIQSRILRDLYSIGPLSYAQQCTLASQHAKTLAECRAALPSFLSVDSKDSAPLIPIFQRQRDTLSIAYWHSIILVQRPFLLLSFGNIRAAGFEAQIANGVKLCLEAALHAAHLGSFYFGFTASVVLYVYTIQEAASPPEVYQIYWDAATRCHDQLARVASPKHIGARYCLVLEMLQLEAKRKIDAVAMGFSFAATAIADWGMNGNSTLATPIPRQNDSGNGVSGGLDAAEGFPQEPVE